MVESLEAFDRVGLLFDWSPGAAELPFIESPNISTFSTRNIRLRTGESKGIAVLPWDVGRSCDGATATLADDVTGRGKEASPSLPRRTGLC